MTRVISQYSLVQGIPKITRSSLGQLKSRGLQKDTLSIEVDLIAKRNSRAVVLKEEGGERQPVPGERLLPGGQLAMSGGSFGCHKEGGITGI